MTPEVPPVFELNAPGCEHLRVECERLRAIASAQCQIAAEAMTERDRLALEARRIRAAESPGKDDGALSGTGWKWEFGAWRHPGTDIRVEPERFRVDRVSRGWVAARPGSLSHERGSLAWDLMRNVVPELEVPEEGV